MGGRSVSGYVEESVATKLGVVAQAEARTPASLVGQATSFYLGLPETARSTLRRLEQIGTPEERQWLEGEFARLLLKANLKLTQRVMAAQVAHALPRDDSDEALDAAAHDWVDARRP